MHAMSARSSYQRERGNILFLILLAVVLFAALSYAVTQSMRGGGKDATDESLQSQASAILQYLKQIDSGVQRLHLSGGVAYETMSFGYDSRTFGGTTITDLGHNSVCTTDACRVFRPAGGGVVVRNFKEYSLKNPIGWDNAWYDGGFVFFGLMQWPGAGTSKSDIVITMPLIPTALCNKINATVRIPSGLGVTGNGNGAVIENPSTWDNGDMRFNAPWPEIYNSDTATSPIYNGDRCDLYHVVVKR